ncbi:hypothetical protein C8R47DRAFT_1057632 [Mycena vitilis]|nr:hypothetical protein C8R47DRAFT_1057632 [Mycena vitilis]
MTGKTQNLSDGSAQALQALLHSLSPDSAAEGGKLSSAAVQKLSAKLAELVGDDDVGEPQHRNEQGQLLNEDGLPIIEITEPVHVSETQPASQFVDEDPPIPAAALPVAEQERRRRERDRILDLLEEEEHMEEVRQQELSEDGHQELLRKRKKAAQGEVVRLKAAKDMQRKMGKALLRDISTSRDTTTPGTPVPHPLPQPEVQETMSPPRKTVTFDVATPDVEASESREVDAAAEWGDVVPARLRATSGRSSISNARFDATPMRMQVVERVTGKPAEEPQRDSDDESEPPDSPTIADSDSEEEGGFESDEELAEEIDLDFARHQREIAMEYHAKRAKMAEVTSNAMQSHFENDIPHKTDSNQSSRKPTLSHFQANRLTSSYNASAPLSSRSMGANVLSASSARTLQRAIRLGKLDSDDRLVGGESGSDGEDDAAMQEVMELLKKGEVYNLGPDGNFLHTVPPPANNPPAVSPPVSAPNPLSQKTRKPQTSKFKLARSEQRLSATTPDLSDPPTPPCNEARSSPKLPAENHPTMSGSSSVLSSSVVEKSSPSAFPSMIVDSPSFSDRRPQQPPTVVRAADRPAKVSRFLAERM